MRKNQSIVYDNAYFETDTPESCGIVEKDEQMVVKNFFEKVDHPPSNIANGAIIAFDSKILDLLSDKFSCI